MKIVLVSKCSLDIEQYVKYQLSVLILPSNSLISSRWVTFCSPFSYLLIAPKWREKESARRVTPKRTEHDEFAIFAKLGFRKNQ